MNDLLMLVCGLVCTTDDPHEEYSFVGIAMPNETPYDFLTRLFQSRRYTHVATVPLGLLPQHAKAWSQFASAKSVDKE